MQWPNITGDYIKIYQIVHVLYKKGGFKKGHVVYGWFQNIFFKFWLLGVYGNILLKVVSKTPNKQNKKKAIGPQSKLDYLKSSITWDNRITQFIFVSLF